MLVDTIIQYYIHEVYTYVYLYNYGYLQLYLQEHVKKKEHYADTLLEQYDDEASQMVKDDYGKYFFILFKRFKKYALNQRTPH